MNTLTTTKKEPTSIFNKCTLFDGLAYNMCGYFASCVVFFQAPQGRGKIRAMGKFVRLCYRLLNHLIRGTLLHCKKIVILQLAYIFLIRVFRNTLIPFVKMASTMNKMFSYVMSVYSPYCKPVKLGHYSVLPSHILRILLTKYGKMAQ